MAKITKTASLLVMLAFSLMSAGCDRSDSQQGAASGKQSEADDASLLCRSIEGAGLASQCTVNSRYDTVDVMIDSNDDEVARQACANIANRMAQLTAHFSGSWKLHILSPLRSDKPMAVCAFH
jgi:hypothetical protein